MQAILMLADGTTFTGKAAGAVGEIHGEVVCNTSTTGYQEILSDAANYGEIVVMTYPLIGNYGVNDDDIPSVHRSAKGFVVHNLCEEPSNWRASGRLSDFLVAQGVVTITGIDTRALTRHLRQYGTMKGAIACGEVDNQALLNRIHEAPDISQCNLVEKVTTPQPYVVGKGEGAHIVVIDLGTQKSHLRCLQIDKNKVTVLPAYTSASDVLSHKPMVVVLSNGPGDPQMAQSIITMVRELLGKVALFGIGLGHQILGLALGADTYKMDYGHRGANQPVQELASERVFITTQNHGFAIVKDSIPEELVISHVNLNDGTVEGFRHRNLPLACVQYQPDDHHLFAEFLAQIG